MRVSIHVDDLANLMRHTAHDIPDAELAVTILDMITRDIARHEGVPYEVIFDAVTKQDPTFLQKPE